MDATRIRVVIVDDEPAHAEAIRRALQDTPLEGVLGMGTGGEAEIRVAGTLREYRELVADRSPDIALLDFNLPDGRAIEALTAPPEAGVFPIVIMTSYGNEQTAVEAMKAGALDYVVKSPEAFAAMPHTVERALREWNLLQERKRVEEALRESEEKFRLVVEHANEGIFVIQDATYKFVNDYGASYLGYTREEILAMRPFQMVHPEDCPLIEARVRRRLAGEKLEDIFDHRVVDAHGQVKWVTTWGVVTTWEDRPASLAFIIDITERKRAEEALRESEARFRKILEMAPLPLCYVDTDGTITFRNERFVQVFGYTADDVPTLTEWWPRAYPDAQYRQWVNETWDAAVKRAAEEGRDIEPLEYKVTCKSGEERIIEISGITLGDDFLATFVDLTERKRAEEALRQLNAELEQRVAERTKELSLANLDLTRAPLSSYIAPYRSNLCRCGPTAQRDPWSVLF